MFLIAVSHSYFIRLWFYIRLVSLDVCSYVACGCYCCSWVISYGIFFEGNCLELLTFECSCDLFILMLTSNL